MTAIALTQLPYANDALSPVISKDTVDTHHGLHHKGYVDNTLRLIAGTPLEGKSLEEVVLAAKSGEGPAGLFNQAGQVYNHDLYWLSLTPGGSAPEGALAAAINEQFGGLEALNQKLVETGIKQFASGWVWLSVEGGKLVLESTSNAETPLTRGAKPILVLDVWEHAYYIDYKNKRQAHLEAVVKLIDWRAASARFVAG